MYQQKITSDINTVDAALLEMRQLLINYGQIGKQERLQALLDMLLESTNKLNSKQRKDSLKVIGIIGEVYQRYIFVSWNRICKVISKKICDDDTNTYLLLAENVGTLVQKAFQLDDEDQTFEVGEIKLFWNQLLALYFSLITNSTSSMSDKKKSIAASMCLSISIQSAPQNIVSQDRIEVCLQIMKPLQKDNSAAENQLLDCLLSLIVACEEQFEDCCDFCVPFIIELLSNEQNVLIQSAINMNQSTSNANWQKRKISIDIIYTLSVLTPSYISLYKDQCLELVNSFKYDKIKNVREAAQVAIISLQDLVTLKQQKYIQTVSSENLSSSRDKNLLSSQRDESRMKRNLSNSYLKNISNSDMVNDLSRNQIEEQKQEEEEEQQQQNQSDSQIPELVDLQLDREEIDQALNKLKRLQEQDEQQQKQSILQSKENQPLVDSNQTKNSYLKKKAGSTTQLAGLKRLSPDPKKNLLVQKDMQFNDSNKNNKSSPPQRLKSNPRKRSMEQQINKEFLKNAPKSMVEIKLQGGQNNSKNLIDERSNFHRIGQSQLSDKNDNRIQIKVNQSSIDTDLKQIDENIKKIQSDLKVYEELLSSGEKLSKDRASASPINKFTSPKNNQDSMEEIDQRQKSLPRDSSFSPSRNYMGRKSTQQKKRQKIFENSPLGSNRQISLSNNTNRTIGTAPQQNQSRIQSQINIITNNSNIQGQEEPVKTATSSSPGQRNIIKPQSISPTSQIQPYIPQQYRQPNQKQYKPIFQQPIAFNRSISQSRFNNFEQQIAQLSDSNLQFNVSQSANESAFLKEKIKQLEEENLNLKLQLNERNIQSEQQNQQINEMKQNSQNTLQQLNNLQTEKQKLVNEHLERESNLQNTIHQLNFQIQDLKSRVEQLLTQQIEQGQFSSEFSIGQSNNNANRQQNLSNNQTQPFNQSLQYQQQYPLNNVRQQNQQIILLNQNNGQQNNNFLEVNKINTLKKIQQNQDGGYQIAQQLVKSNAQLQETTKQKSISPLEKIELNEYQKSIISNQEQTAKFCQNNKFSFDQKQDQQVGQMPERNNSSKSLLRNDSQTLKKHQTYKHETLSSFSPENSFVPSSNFWKEQLVNDDSIKQSNWVEGEVSLNQLNKTLQKVDQAINVSNTHINQLQFSQNTKNDERFNQNIEKNQNRKRSLLNGTYNEVYLYETVENQEKVDRLQQVNEENQPRQQNESKYPQINILIDSQSKMIQQQKELQQYETEQKERDQLSSQKKRSLNPYQQLESTKPKVEIPNTKQYQTENINKIFEYLQNQQYNEALEIALTQQDDEFLIQVLKLSDMEDCIKQLDETHGEYLLTKLKGMLYNRQHLEQCLPWITHIVESQIRISKLLLTSLKDTINIILDQQQNPYEPYHSIKSVDEQQIKQILSIISSRI